MVVSKGYKDKMILNLAIAVSAILVAVFVREIGEFQSHLPGSLLPLSRPLPLQSAREGKMKALVIEQYGEPSDPAAYVYRDDMPIPHIAPNELLVQVSFSSVNPGS